MATRKKTQLKKIDLSIVIPAYREESLIKDSLDEVAGYIKTELNGLVVEVILVTADPPEGTNKTAEIVEQYNKMICQYQVVRPGVKVGKGRDVRAGMMVASGKICLFTDADLATDLTYIKPAYEIIDSQKADIVVGKRDIHTMHDSFVRKITSLIARRLIRLIAVKKIEDTQCGFKVFSAECKEALFSNLITLGWGFDIEILRRAQLQGYNIFELEIPDWKDPKEVGLVFENQLVAQLKTLKELLKVRYKIRK